MLARSGDAAGWWSAAPAVTGLGSLLALGGDEAGAGGALGALDAGGGISVSAR